MIEDGRYCLESISFLYSGVWAVYTCQLSRFHCCWRKGLKGPCTPFLASLLVEQGVSLMSEGF